VSPVSKVSLEDLNVSSCPSTGSFGIALSIIISITLIIIIVVLILFWKKLFCFTVKAEVYDVNEVDYNPGQPGLIVRSHESGLNKNSLNESV
jgi:hypothetical protein